MARLFFFVFGLDGFLSGCNGEESERIPPRRGGILTGSTGKRLLINPL